MTPPGQPAAAFQHVLQHHLLANPSAQRDNTATFTDTLTTWPSFLNRQGEVPAVAGLVVNVLPGAALAEGYLRALQPRQVKVTNALVGPLHAEGYLRAIRPGQDKWE
jgi:hypothetical protein